MSTHPDRWRLVFMGTPAFACTILEALLARPYPVVGVVCQPDRPRGRGLTLTAPEVKQAAARAGLPVLQPERLRDPAFMDALRALAPDLIVVAAYGKILPRAILDLPPRGCINVHASLLPAWRGAAPIARAILAGETRTGVTTMRMDRGLDTGDILLSRVTDIGVLETAGELTVRLGSLGADLLLETLATLGRGALTPRPQDGARATLAPPLTREDGRVSWEDPADAVARRVRGCNPWPLAAAGLRGGRVQILRASSEAGGGHGDPPAPGQVIEARGDRLVVACGAGTRLAILEIGIPGRQAMSARDALNGRLVGPGDRFTTAPL